MKILRPVFGAVKDCMITCLIGFGNTQKEILSTDLSLRAFIGLDLNVI